jgi:toluene monooxygenase system ferredoxin subunit
MSAEATERWSHATPSDELWDGELTPVTVDGIDLILMRVNGAAVAYEDSCPHSGTALSNGTLEDGVLTCSAHLWQFDAATGNGVNPKTCRLASVPIKEEGGAIYVRLER